MKQIKNLSIFMLVALMATFASCSKDDDNADFDLKSYIIGTWRSYKGTVYLQGGAYSGQTVDVNIGKTGQYSDAYRECTFQEGGKIKIAGFKQDENGISHWFEEYGTYSINGDIVTIRDNEGETDDLVYDEKNKTLCLQGTYTQDGISMKILLFFKK